MDHMDVTPMHTAAIDPVAMNVIVILVLRAMEGTAKVRMINFEKI